jgi:hypothetical protein
MWDPLSEDIRRRYKDPKESLPAWVYCLLPVIGPRRTTRLVDTMWHIERLRDARMLRPLLQVK